MPLPYSRFSIHLPLSSRAHQLRCFLLNLTAAFKFIVEGVTDDSRTTNSALECSLSEFVTSRRPPVRLLGLGEPTHGDETFLALRNDLFVHLVLQHGFVAIALETGQENALLLDDYVCGLDDDLDRVLEAGFTHGFGRFTGNRDLLLRLRELNTTRDPSEQVHCMGVDAQMELTAQDYASAERAKQRIVERTARMVDNVDQLLRQARGPVLLHAHNSHLQRAPSSMRLGPNEIEWEPLGMVLNQHHPGQCPVVLISCSAAPASGVPPAPEGTIEHRLDLLRQGSEPFLVGHSELIEILDSGRSGLQMRRDLTPGMALGPIDPDTLLTATDTLIHVPQGRRGPVLTPERIRAMFATLPDVQILLAGPETDAPENAWGDTFFTVQPPGHQDPRRMPFATIVTSNYPGVDDSSRLDRDDTFALNLRVGPQYFEGLLGFAPKDAPAHSHLVDPAATAQIMPHPLYASQGWIRVLNPPAAQAEQLLGLASSAVELARRRIIERAALSNE